MDIAGDGVTLHVEVDGPDAPLKIVAFGDSLTAGYGLPAQDAFPAKLERALKAKGVAFTMEPTTIRPGVRIAFLRAPENVSIELLQRG